jgi:pSer/pThr/pTyr-binding forkhead associated (FHA) protein
MIGEAGLSALFRNHLLYTFFILLDAAVIVVILILWIARRRKEQQRELEWNQKVGGIGEPIPVTEPSGGADRTMDAWEMNPDAFGMLTVTASDDPSMLGQRFEITNRRTTLGRKADNDIIFPKDSPISRRHAVVEEKNGGLFLSEVDDMDEKTGAPKRPTYGTFINENEVGTKSVLLQTGAEMRLGKRVRLKYEAGTRVHIGNEKTLDDFASSGDSGKTAH